MYKKPVNYVLILLISGLFTGCGIFTSKNKVPIGNSLQSEQVDIREKENIKKEKLEPDDTDTMIQWITDDIEPTTDTIRFKNGIEIRLPENWVNNVIVGSAEHSSPTNVFIYDKRNFEAGFGGILFILSFNCKMSPPSKVLLFDSQHFLGVYKNSNFEYALVTGPSREGMWSETDEDLQNIYFDLINTMDEIEVVTDNMTGFTKADIDDIDWVEYFD